MPFRILRHYSSYSIGPDITSSFFEAEKHISSKIIYFSSDLFLRHKPKKISIGKFPFLNMIGFNYQMIESSISRACYRNRPRANSEHHNFHK